MDNRINKTVEILNEYNVSAFFITNLADIRYLSGFTGSTAYMFITRDKTLFITDGRYKVQSSEELKEGIEILIAGTGNITYEDAIKEEAAKHKKILVQGNCTVEAADILKAAGAETVIDAKSSLLTMRMIKDDEEIKLIKEQYKIAGTAFLKSLENFRTGETERNWAAALEYNIKCGGADGTSFETITASGERGAMPHGRASDKIIRENEPVIIDFGSCGGYTSDYTRMVYGGRDKEVLKVIDIVKTAVLKSIESVKSGLLCKDIDKIARDYIASRGYGGYFNHSLGHGVGLDVHELPVLRPAAETEIKDGMIFTIEPGIYLPGKFGVRIEETVLVKNGKSEVISDIIGEQVYKPS